VDGVLIREKSAIVFERTIQDDYVKFFALARNLVTKSGTGVLGFISNSSYQDNINLRGMRCELIRLFDQIEIVDLHGAALQDQSHKSDQRDQNVFDIRTAVSIFIGSSNSAHVIKKISRCDLYGSRDSKSDLLKISISSGLTNESVDPRGPKYIFLHTNQETQDAYDAGISIEELFSIRASGIQTGKDEILIDFTKADLKKKLLKFADPATSIDEIVRDFNCGSGYGEKLLAKRKSIQKDDKLIDQFASLMFTPFDSRFVFYRKDIVKVHSDEASRHIVSGKNLNLIVVRQVAGKSFSHAFVTRSLANQRSFYSTRGTTYQVPIMNIDDGDNELLFEANETNFVVDQARRLIPQELPINTENLLRLFYFIYAQMYSSEYRDIFKDELQRDYPRVFSGVNLSMFEIVAELGQRLVSIHCGDEKPSEDPSASFFGSFSTEVERPIFSDGTIWLDRDQTFGISGVDISVWNLEIGGYKVCEKWLKDRKNRKLSKSERDTFARVLSTLSETLKIQDAIDSVIRENGGWHDSFIPPEN
jgi:predicted helicase